MEVDWLGDTAPTAQADVRLQLLNVPVRLVCSNATVRELLASIWSRCLDTEPGAQSGLTMLVDVDSVVAGHALVARLTSSAATEAARGRVTLLRAAGCANDQGLVVALVGGPAVRRDAVVMLALSGFGYVTDEIIAVGPTGDVMPFPRPLVLDQPPRASDEGLYRSPDAVGLAKATPPLSLQRIVVVEVEHDAPRGPAVEALGVVDGLRVLARQRRWMGEVELPLQHLLDVMRRCGGVFRLTCQDVRQIREPIDELLGSPESCEEVVRWTPVVSHRPDPGDVSWALMDGRVRQVPYLDALAGPDGDLLVLVAGATIPTHLSALGVTIWEAAAAGPTMDALTDAVILTHGPHPQAAELVRTAVTSMRQSNLVHHALPRMLDDVLGGAPR